MINIIPQALAQSFPDINPIDPSRFNSVSDVLLLIINGLLVIAGALAVIYIILAGFTYITSAGDPDKAQKAKGGLVYAIIGIVVISFSYAIVNVVIDILQKDPAIQTSPAPGPGAPSQPGPGTPPPGTQPQPQPPPYEPRLPEAGGAEPI